MKIALLDNITGFGKHDWSVYWVLIWFSCGLLALFFGFWTTTEQTALDWFYFAVSIIGLLCVVGLSFRKNIAGNGLGMLATAGEVVVQATSGAVGLMLAPLFNFFSHAYGVKYWASNTDADGDMVPKSANKYVWLLTVIFIIAGLLLFPAINRWLQAQGYGVISDDGSRFLGMIDFFWINVVAFVLSITAQATMILRYSFNWWLWILVNAVWLIVNLMTGNTIFAIQTVIYQVNAVVGLYGWYRSEQLAKGIH
ncbi:nicotinamide riboside transporter PnuC [Moraxella sp. FZLJ2107]|uniref:nicotinamide riboside transporter PnuC n=1 Tax=unclassified Moraxella TaxID=2685852 RepID=UPI0020C9154B|nr:MULTISPECIES: nicotinamide riboside transporter PnuC [unclassified Moraxella]UTO04179.1 nicotinamide riboside transporter PnuC [Moraxella sp. FZLJ2107]UTO23012.1 nicotinamide riboside transporter PnuC [Moraxella sp. FZLJ2109]